ncbi:MAG: glycosyl transferase family 1 [Methylomarinum sp.]|nr:glycosyl transferase family 1 [Methylomarinum sp.]
MKHILFFAEAVTLAHIARCITLANKIHASGQYIITIAADNRYDEIIGAVPFQRIPLKSISSHYFAKKLADGLPIYNVQTLTDYVNEDLSIIDEIKPDFIFGDFRLSLSISARIKKTPYASITNAYWSPYADIKYPVPEIPLTKFVGVSIAQKVFDLVRPVVFKLHTLAFNKVCKKFRQPLLGSDLREVYTHADYTLYADAKALIPMHSLPENHIFIGPLLWSAKVSLPVWWDTLPSDKPIVFITLGSSGDSSLLPMLLETLNKMPVTVLCVTAKKVKLDKSYSNVFSAEFLPAELVVKKADIVICNGGSPMVYQSIVEKKIVIGLPSNLDQYLMMTLADATGFGQLIRAGKANSYNIERAVNKGLAVKKKIIPEIDCSLDINEVIKIIDTATIGS